MPEAPLLRLVELVRRELGAQNARVELGGDPEDRPTALWRALPGGWRVVVLFQEPPPDREDRLARLDALVQSFSGLASEAASSAPPLRVPTVDALSAALADVASRAGGADAAVIDVRSPMVWGCSDPSRTRDENVRAAVEAAGLADRARAAGIDPAPLLALEAAALGPALAALDTNAGLRAELGRQLRVLRSRAPHRDAAGWRRALLLSRAIAAARRPVVAPVKSRASRPLQRDGLGVMVRGFAGIYVLVIAFDGPFSELHAEAAIVHALPRLERLVLALPPVPPTNDTPAAAARVVPLASRRRRRR